MQPETSSAANNIMPRDSTAESVHDGHHALAIADPPLPPASRRNHLAFLDGIRGLSALYVVLFHCVLREDLGGIGRRLTDWMHYGRFAVDVFIVLSGYCLMLPVARSSDRQLRGGIGAYLKRRARRILPPYYASMAVAAVVICLGRFLKHGHVSAGAADPAALTPGNIVTHLLLIHNLFRSYVVSLNPVLWTVALEWQLYFVFPLVLLPLWRRAGLIPTLFFACLIGLSPLVLSPHYNLGWTCPWFVGLFAMGMSAAVLTESKAERLQQRVSGTPWGLLCLLGLMVTLLCRWPSNIGWWLKDLLVGAAAAALILHCVRSLRSPSSGKRDLLVRLFESPSAVRLGMFSYSLYLIHEPINWVSRAFLRMVHLSPRGDFVFSLLITVPLVIALAYGFFLLAERPFLTSKSPARPA